ncbi:MAG: type IV toxin-antitoxin system AbiEi family antitoxin domain-containing protein [Propionibacteriaceae bacterium]|nr:type IV toxin-antitoxin system AbiEi family antitoxin domain-containing protein [Propionibacteriaceae bacterium]
MPRRPPALPGELAAIACLQEGLISARQAIQHGLSRQRASEAVQRGDWRRVMWGVYDLSPVVPLIDRNPIDRRRRRAAFLGALAYPGAVVTGVCALVLHGIMGAPATVVPEVSFPDRSPREPRHPVRLRRIRVDRPVLVDGIAIAPMIDALAQAVPTLERRHAVALMDSAQLQGKLSPAGLERAHDLARFHRGVRRTHSWWAESDRRSESPAETWARLACADAGIPPDVLQLLVLGPDGRMLARVDLAWLLPDGRWLLVEIDGCDEHDTPAALYRDRARQNSILTDRTVIRRFTGKETQDGTLVNNLTSLLRNARWHPNLAAPTVLHL